MNPNVLGEIPAEETSPAPQPQANPKERKFQKWLEKHEQGPLPLVLSFVLPALIFAVCLAVGLGKEAVYPFGDGQIINYDGWHQYYPFLLKLWDHFREGTSLLYDWSMGMGTNFLSMLAYYGTSPLNLLLALVPVREFRLLFTLFVVIRIGFAGFSMALFLKKFFAKTSWSLPFFALGYALCGYLMGYFWNVMWLDAVALLPLLCVGGVKLFREGKCSLYVFTVFLSLFSNYYIGYMSLIFIVLGFFALCIFDRVRVSHFFAKGFRLLFATLLGVGMSAVILLPAYFGLLNTASTRDAVGVYSSFYESVQNLLATLTSFHEPVYIDGLPNLSTAAILILFAFAFLWAKKIGLREKLVGFFLLVFLVFAMNYSVTNYIFHGFHFTNQIPYRFAFLFAFTVVVMAYAYYRKALADFDWIDALGAVLFTGVLAFCAFGLYSQTSILLTVFVMALTTVLCALCSRGFLGKKAISLAVCLILLVEMTASSYLGIKAVGTSSYSQYYDAKTGEEILSLVEEVKNREGDGFYRMETTEWRSLNDSCFYGYNGISQFASSANRNVSHFLKELGMPADPGSNRFVYVHGTPLANTLLGVKYLITKTGYLSDSDLVCITPATNTQTSALYECTGFSGLAFMVEEEAANFTFDSSLSPYQKQNALFSAITGLEGELFTPISPKESMHTNLEVTVQGEGFYDYTGSAVSEEDPARVLHFLYEMPTDGMVYIYANVPDSDYVQVNNAWHCIEEYPNFFSAGYFSKENTFHLRSIVKEEGSETCSGTASFDVVVMNQALWEEGIALLQDETLNITSFESTRVEGVVTAKEDGFLYTSIPMELEGAWTVKVDGKTTPVTPFAGSFVALSLPAGEHTVEFTYSPPGFEKGLIISLVCLLLWASLVALEKKKNFVFLREKPIPETAPQEEPREEEGQEEGKGEESDRSETHVPDQEGS